MSTLLVDWYFARCAHLEPEEQDAFLDAMQCVRTLALDPSDVTEAVRILLTADRRVQVYAFPALLRTLATSPSNEVRGAIAEGLHSVVSGGTIEVGAALELVDAVALVGEGRSERLSAADLLGRWSTLAIVASERGARGERTPYFQVAVEVWSTILLAAARELADADAGCREVIADRLDRAVEDDGDPLALVLQGAAAGRFGRVALLLAADVTGRCLGPERAVACTHAARQATPDGRLEPDLAFAAATWMPLSKGLLTDTATLAGLVMLDGGTKAPTPSPEFLRRVGFGADARSGQGLGPMAYQLGLLARGLRAPGSDDATSQLAAVFSLRPATNTGELRVPGGVGKQALGWLRPLARIGGASGALAVEAARGGTDEARLATLVTSPWVLPEVDADHIASYRRARSGLGALRVATVASLGCEALGAPEPPPGPVRLAIVAAVLHAESVLTQWLATGRARTSTTAMAAASWRAARGLASGRLASVTPGAVLDAIAALEHVEVADEDLDLRDAWADDLLAGRLRWLQDAVPEFDREDGPGRWRTPAASVVKDLLTWSGPDRVDAIALDDLCVLAGADPQLTDRDVDSWDVLAEREERPSAREILVAPAATALEWSVERVDLTAPARLALAIRRLDASDGSDASEVGRLTSELNEAAALVLGQDGLELALIARTAALVGRPALRGAPEQASQIAGLSISSGVALAWLIAFREALAGVDRERPIAGQSAWSVLRVALAYLRAHDDGPDRERLQVLWRGFAVRLLGEVEEEDRASLIDELTLAADLHGRRQAAIGAAPFAVDEIGVTHEYLGVPALPLGRDVAPDASALVLDPWQSRHGAWIRMQGANGGAAVRRLIRADRGAGRILRIEAMSTKKALDSTLWDADTSRAFCDVDAPREVVAVASDGDLVPHVRPTEALVLSLLRVGVDASATLVCNGREAEGLLFSTVPGDLYRLRSDDFGDADAVAFGEEIRSHEDPTGLLVTVSIDGSGRFRLAAQPPVDSIHTGLVCPFDARNLQWRRLLAGTDEVLVAQRDEDGLAVVIEAPPGFPSRLEVSLTNPARHGTVHVDRPRFDDEAQRTAIVRTRVAREARLHGEVSELVHELWEREAWIELDKVLFTRDDGKWVCTTSAGWRVPVRPETISLAPLAADAAATVSVQGRQAFVIGFPQEGQALSLDPEDAPADLLRALEGGGSIRGVVGSLVRDTDQAILFLDASVPIELAVRLGKIRAYVGSRVRVTKALETGDFTVEVINVSRDGHAAWTTSTSLRDGGVFVGQIADDDPRDVIELAPGQVALVPSSSEVPLFSKRVGDAWEAPAEDWRRCRIVRATRGGGDERTSVTAGGFSVDGVTTRQLGVGPGELRGASLRLQGHGQVRISRQFVIASRDRTAGSGRPGPRSEPPARPSQIDVAAELARLIDEGRPVEVTVESPPRTATVDVLVQLGCSRHEAKLPVIGRAAFVTGEKYGTSGRADVVREDAGFGLSFEEVPSLDLVAFFAEIGAVPGTEIARPPLIYARAEDGEHTFEFGFGRRVRIPTEQIRFDGGPFEQVAEVLFHGDRVQKYTFVEEDDGPVLDVREAEIVRSAGTRLYRQARDHRFVHLVRVVEDADGRVRVTRIDGFNDRTAQEDEPRDRMSGDRIAATVFDPGTEPLEIPDEGLVVYAELDQVRFEETLGTELRYERRHLATDVRGGGVVTFVKGGRIQHRGNEVLLRLKSATSDPKEVANGLVVLHRGFSVDPYQLERLDHLEGSAALEDRLLVAWIPAAGERATAMLSHGTIPSRRPSTLGDLLGDEGLLLLVDSVSEERVRLEYRSGITFDPSRAKLTGHLTDLRKGDLVRVQARGDRLELVRCSFSDTAFFGEYPRPLVALPTNPLLTDDAAKRGGEAAFWANPPRGAGFVPGGLPGSIARPGSRQRRADGTYVWGPPNTERLAQLMATDHPKIGSFGLDNKQQLRMVPSSAKVAVGAVRFDGAAASTVIEGRTAPAAAEGLTFADQSVAELAERTSAVRWWFHDAQTGSWVDGGARSRKLGAQSLQKGPVFFADGSRLRYRRPHLRSWAFPGSFLAQAVDHGGEPITVAVAAVHRTKPDGPADGLYLEIVPGVVCLLLAPQLQIRLGSGMSRPLTDISVASFGVGDLLDLVVVQDPARSVDGIDVVGWQRSSRIVGGRERAVPKNGRPGTREPRLVLPRQGYDPDTGALTLGHGAYTVVAPTSDPPDGELMVLDDDPVLTRFRGRLRPGDVVLVGTDGPRFRVHGLANVSVNIAELPEEDPWHQALRRDGRQVVGPLRDAINAIGGALPATVASVSGDGARICISFEQQTIDAAERTELIGTVVGIDHGFALVLAGPSTIRLRFADLVPGVPHSQTETLVRALVAAQTIVVVRRAGARFEAVPLAGDQQGSPRFRAEVIVDDEDASGIIVRQEGTWALGWIPATRLALAASDPADWHTIWVDGNRPLAAVRKGGSDTNGPKWLSLIDRPEVVEERRSLRVGAHLDVDLLSARPDGTFLASTGTGSIIRFAPLDPGAWAEGDQVRAVVEGHDARWTAITAVPVEDRRVTLGLPGQLRAMLRGDADVRRFAAVPESLGSQLDELRLAASGPSALSAAALRLATEVAPVLARQPEVDAADALLVSIVLLRHALAPAEELVAVGAIEDEETAERGKEHHRRKAEELLASIGRRAVRSIHLEVFARAWLANRDDQRGYAWRRLDHAMQGIEGPVRAGAARLLGSVAEHLEVAGGDEGRRTAAALRVAGGDAAALVHLLSDQSLVLPSIVTAVQRTCADLRTTAADTPLPDLGAEQEAQLADLEVALDRLRLIGAGTVLLADSPWFRNPVVAAQAGGKGGADHRQQRPRNQEDRQRRRRTQQGRGRPPKRPRPSDGR